MTMTWQDSIGNCWTPERNSTAEKDKPLSRFIDLLGKPTKPYYLYLSSRTKRKEKARAFMASKLHLLQSKAAQASKLVSKHGRSYYDQLLEQNKQYIKDPPTVDTCQLLSNQLFYTRLASIPVRYESFWKELNYVKQQLKNWPELKTEDIRTGALFGLECFAWFCAGEIVGRGFTFTGYYV